MLVPEPSCRSGVSAQVQQQKAARAGSTELDSGQAAAANCSLAAEVLSKAAGFAAQAALPALAEGLALAVRAARAVHSGIEAALGPLLPHRRS